MFPPSQLFWRKTYQVRDQLLAKYGPTCFLTSIEPPIGIMTTPGATAEATALNAAQRIVSQTHREATAEEIQKFHELQKENFKLVSSQERRNQHRRTLTEV
jgi:hypothetical protein